MKSTDSTTSETKELVVLLHGFAASRWVMWPIGCWLKRSGFDVAYWPYWSLTYPIATHAEQLADYLSKVDSSGRRYSIVAHSMGSIITRAALLRGAFTGLKSVVLLAPPNRGLPLARYAPHFVRQFLKPLTELSDANDSYVNSLPRISPQGGERSAIGVIAARYDEFIPMASTRLDGRESHVTLNATHNSLLVSIKVAKLIESFLKTGRFHATGSLAETLDE
jgi:triacylglycerol esterase/lipase EstA (alpha/beta hydrolase family)